MKQYLAPNRIPVFGMILLLIGSVFLGIAIGVLAYFVSNLIYYIFAFSLVLGGATMIAYYRLLQFAKVRHSIIAALMGLITGLLVALAYYATPYCILRNEFITNAQQNYQVSAERASAAFVNILVEETGTGGFIGYMKLRAKEGDQFTNYVVANGMPIHEFSFTLKSAWAWIYWLLETLFFSIPTAWIGYDVGKRAFSESANDWYNPLPNQICTLPLESKDKIFSLLKDNSLQEISELAVPEEKIAHPMVEIYEQHSNNKKGDILLSVKQTYRNAKDNIKRNVIAQWEVSEPKYTSFVNAVNRRLAE
jgi:hypothetical protein